MKNKNRKGKTILNREKSAQNEKDIDDLIFKDNKNSKKKSEK
jgi:hypothetical protein